MSEPETIELDRLALMIGHKEILIMRQQDQISALLAQSVAQRKKNAESEERIKELESALDDLGSLGVSRVPPLNDGGGDAE